MAELKYVIRNGNDFEGLMWKTKMGNIITMQGKININNGLEVIDIETHEIVKDIDLIDTLAEILSEY